MKKTAIEPVEARDLAKLTSWITDEFPYFKTDAAHYASRLSRRPLESYKITIDKTMVGYIEIEHLGKSIARINGMGIDPAYRNQGLAQKLLEFILAKLEKNAIHIVRLLVHPKNTVAQHVYAKHGFHYKGPYANTINGEIVEEWEKHIG